MDTSNLFIWFASLLCVSALKITQLRVPSAVDLSVHDSAILDCDYEVDNTDGLVVKWFIVGRSAPVYQWIIMRKPQVLGVLKGRLDLDYKASDRNESMYRALKIKDLSLDLSGEYKCVVSTFLEEESMTKKMIVFKPANNVNIMEVKPNNNTTQIICSAQGISPKPDISLNTTESIPLMDQEIVETKTEDGLYNITSLFTFHDDSIQKQVDINCVISIPGTSYSRSVVYVHYPEIGNGTNFEIYSESNITMTNATEESAGSTTTPITWLCVSSLLLLAASWT